MEYNIVPDYTVKDGKRISRFWGFDIDKVEKLKNAKFVCEIAARTKGGGWSEEPLAIFWQELPPVEGYSNYFGLFQRIEFGENGPEYGSLYITSGQSAVEDSITAIVAANGDVVYSAYRHDFRNSPDGSVWIDGGRDYVRTGSVVPENGGSNRFVTLKFVKDKLVVEEAVNSDLK
jgi:hypothetical protein